MKTLETLCKQHIKLVITDYFVKLPGGRLFWSGLKDKGKKSRRVLLERWSSKLTNALFNVELKQAMLLACLDEQGFVDDRGEGLYHWLVKYVYDYSERELYKEWVALREAVNKKKQIGQGTRYFLSPIKIKS